MKNSRWGISKKHKAIWFYKRLETGRAICWSKNKEELNNHLKRCKDIMTNLDYLEGLKLLEKLKEN